MLKKIEGLLTILLLFSVLCASVWAETDGLDMDLKSKLDNFLGDSLKAAHVPDAAVIIVDPDGIVYEYKYGEVSSLDDKFVLGSTSKSFTALAVMKLVENGSVNLDDKISKYIPSDVLNRDISDKITVRNLLNHTSGIRGDSVKSIENLTNIGEFSYSNNNYSLLALVIENASKKPYDEYMRENVFEPLDMKNTTASLQNNHSEEFISGHKVYFGIPFKSSLSWAKEDISAGYIVTTPNDMGNYLKMYLNGGQLDNNIIIDKAFLDQMYHGGSSLVEAQTSTATQVNYGMGWFWGERYNTPSYWHGGTVESYSSRMAVLPEKKFAYIVMLSVNDMITGADLYNPIDEGITALLSGYEPNPVSTSAYWTSHWKINILMLIGLVISFIPIILIKRWKFRTKNNKSPKGKQLIFWAISIFIHFCVPLTVGIVLLGLSGSISMLFGFIPDIASVYVICSIVLVVTGIYKVVYIIKTIKDKG